MSFPSVGAFLLGGRPPHHCGVEATRGTTGPWCYDRFAGSLGDRGHVRPLPVRILDQPSVGRYATSAISIRGSCRACGARSAETGGGNARVLRPTGECAPEHPEREEFEQWATESDLRAGDCRFVVSGAGQRSTMQMTQGHAIGPPLSDSGGQSGRPTIPTSAGQAEEALR